MKIRKILTFLSIIAIFFAASCANKEKPQDVGALDDLPAWVIDPNDGIKSGIAGVGIASKSRGGIKFQIPKAEMDAKANIAAIIQSEISRVSKEALRNSKINDVDDAEEFFSQATKEVVQNVPLSGIKRINIHKSKDGTLYVRMILTGQDYSEFLQSSEKSFKDRLRRSKMARENINDAEEAAKSMFNELEKERNR